MIEGNKLVYECSCKTENTPQYRDYENSTYNVVSKMAFLLGVEKRHFENEHEPPKMEWYEKLHQDKNARIIRNLCAIMLPFPSRCAMNLKIYTLCRS